MERLWVAAEVGSAVPGAVFAARSEAVEYGDTKQASEGRYWYVYPLDRTYAKAVLKLWKVQVKAAQKAIDDTERLLNE